MSEAGSNESYICPRCSTTATRDALAVAHYVCPRCTLEVAHLQLTPTGNVRGVIGWLVPVGEVLHDRYRVTGVLGKGGFAAAYLVQDLRLNGKARALKEIPADYYDATETELLSRLHHPAIPDITDRFEANGMVYLVLEFGGNRTLESERRASGGTIPLARLQTWMRDLFDVLTYLHEHDPPIVHRDLKPDNILLDEKDRVMLIDFGIAKEGDSSIATRAMGRAGTHGFSPPEQVLSTGTDQRADVYAAGATAYALLTGVLPVPAHARVAGTELPSPRSLTAALPESLDSAIMRALELNVHGRQQSIAELRRDFEQTSEALPNTNDFPDIGRTALIPEGAAASAKPFQDVHAPAPGNGWLLVVLFVAGLTAFAGGAWWIWHSFAPMQEAETPKPIEAVVTDAPPPVEVQPVGLAPTGPPFEETVAPLPAQPVRLPNSDAAPPPADRGGSAVGALQEALRQKPAEPPPAPARPVQARAPAAKPRAPKASRPPRQAAAAAAPPHAKAAPAPAKAAPAPAKALDWTIIHEGTTRTD